MSAVGEQYVELLPRTAKGPSLKERRCDPRGPHVHPAGYQFTAGSGQSRSEAIPRENVKTVVDESYAAVGGLGPDLSRLVNGTTALAIDARKNLDALVGLIEQSKPLLDSQTESSDSVRAWAAHLATVT